VEEHGRVEELQTAMLFNLRSWKPFRDATKGFRLMLKGAITPKDLLPGKKAKRAEAARIFEKLRRDKDSGAAI
jgi:hypothetical protein